MKTSALLVVVSLWAACGGSGPARTPDTDRLAAAAVTAVQQAQAETLAQYFNYPETSDIDRTKDRRGVERLLKVVFNEFGSISEARELTFTPETLNVFVGSGTATSLLRDAIFVRYVYAGRFSVVGDGYVFIDIAKYNAGLRVRAVTFALAKNRPDAAAIVQRTIQQGAATFD